MTDVRRRIMAVMEDAFLDDAEVMDQINTRLTAVASALRGDPTVQSKTVSFRSSHNSATLSWEQDFPGEGHRKVSVIAGPGSGPGDVVHAAIVHPTHHEKKKRFGSVEEFVRFVRGL
jgi:hypothetical protein